MSNPFTLQTDNKKFFTAMVGAALDRIYENPTTQDNARRIRNMNDELNQLAKNREQRMFKEQQIDYFYNRQKPLTGLEDFVTGVPDKKNDKKYRVRTLLKEKKESMFDFLNKKKEIYLSKMNINIKNEKIKILADKNLDIDETLKARKLYFENDVQFMHRFIDGIKKQAEEAQAASEAEAKQQQILVSKLNSLEAQIQKVDNMTSKDQQILENLEMYKKFIEELYDPDRNWKPYQPTKMIEEILYMTEGRSELKNKYRGLGIVIQYQPENMLQVFNDAQESNIREIQNLQDKEAELETILKQQRQDKTILQTLIRENEGRIAILEATCQKKLHNCTKLKQLRKANNSKLDVLDNENLDLDKLGKKIYEIYKQVNPKRAIEIDKIFQGEIKRQMTQIEQQIERLRILIAQQKEKHDQQSVLQVERQIKANQRRQNLLRKQQENKQLQLKKQVEQEKKRNQTQNEKSRGRKDMQKVLIQKKAKKKKETNIKSVDDSDKYLKEEEDI